MRLPCAPLPIFAAERQGTALPLHPSARLPCLTPPIDRRNERSRPDRFDPQCPGSGSRLGTSTLFGLHFFAFCSSEPVVCHSDFAVLFSLCVFSVLPSGFTPFVLVQRRAVTSAPAASHLVSFCSLLPRLSSAESSSRAVATVLTGRHPRSRNAVLS